MARHLDLVVLALALPVFLVAGLPMLGYATAAGAWLAQRGIALLTARRALAATSIRGRVGWTASSTLARAWLVALTILLVGLRDNAAGLAAAVLVVALFTVYFLLELAFRDQADTEAQR
ncbi:MAG: hypothetical protein ACJ76S_10915 [Solirubrobacteraceae bacterium]